MKLDDSGDWQAYACAFRSILEITVDLALLCAEPKNAERITIWETAQQYKHALARLARGENEPGLREFVAEHKNNVEAYCKDRRSGQPPMRWTSNYLVQDVEQVAEKFPDLAVRRAYEEMYVFSNWQIHGSGNIVNALGNDGIVAAMAIEVTMCGQLSLQCIEMARRLVGTFDLPAQKSLSAARKAWTDQGLGKLGFDAENWATAATSPSLTDTRPQAAD